jgi:glycosyltransferase involved in cell wall biosynthesis
MINNDPQVVFHIISGLGDGGAEGVLYRLIKCDIKNTHIVITMISGGKYEVLLKNLGVVVTSLNLERGKFTVMALAQLYMKIRKVKPDVVQTWMYHSDLVGGLIAKIALVKRVIWNVRHSNLNPEDTKSSTIIVARLCALFSYIVPNKIVCCADEAREEHISIGYKSKNMVVISNGYDLSLYKPYKTASVIRNEYNISNSQPLMGMVGRFTPEKDHENLFRAMSQLINKPYLVLAGTGMTDENEILSKLISVYSLTERVILLGQVEDVPSFMNQLDFHVLSSSSEGFPNVLAEAMACEIPCISTEAGSAPLIINNTGWLAPVKQSDALAACLSLAINELQVNKDKWNMRKNDSRTRVMKHFSLNEMVEKYNEVWKSK